MSGIARGILLVAVLAAAGCASPGAVDNPVARKLTWLSYLAGDDLRDACRTRGTGAGDRFRLVFNADYNRHVRTYDVIGDAENGGAVLEARVIQATDIARVDLNDPLGPGRGAVATTRLTPHQFASFVLSLHDSGAFDPLPQRLLLPSNGIYWLVQGCHAGNWFFNAYPYPSDRFADVRFGGPLGAADATGVPFPALPPPHAAPRRLPDGGALDDAGPLFSVEVDADGIVGPTRPFGALIAALRPPAAGAADGGR
ncbi:hypothetical protein [Azospirillum halopraeferens]|uniref:hypothetical protein n=1 Tax=Azospirillum halopraeferens TaxID=34010 RepID=UPI00040C08E2|nr:hypothetical protein [Azospirillum halopraeferens]